MIFYWRGVARIHSVQVTASFLRKLGVRHKNPIVSVTNPGVISKAPAISGNNPSTSSKAGA